MSLLRKLSCADTGVAFDLWREQIGQRSELDLVHAAVLAANAHNSQPWRFSVSHGSIEVRADLDRHLGSFDPFRREMHQSLGCAIENLVQAASAQGLRAEVETFAARLPTNSDDVLAAQVLLSPMPVRQTEFFRAISQRRTHRGIYDRSRKLPASMLRELMTLSDHPQVALMLFDGAARQAELGELIVQSTRQIVADREMAADNAKWFRFHDREIVNRRDGLTLGTNVSSPLIAAAGRLVPPPDKLANRAWVRDTKIHVKTAALLGIIAVPDAHERALAIEVGRLWQRLHLFFTANGVAAQPLNQPIECADRERELDLMPFATEALSLLVGNASLQSAFVFRAGYARHAACRSPRRPLDEVMNWQNGSAQ